ncbi:5-formyltetrahydrofolate cyclo-ligase [Thalassotalea crassostreae]|uniref:5-formyltetrahydrofolate cyclo-ligase n=1 Tax=Thalassotalea crassostreae TaxID=1763536 RepID=UPI000838672A|nr:5-formyltetrahydrofolate cyclo-ligase [Thalassotalea crassostreae]
MTKESNLNKQQLSKIENATERNALRKLVRSRRQQMSPAEQLQASQSIKLVLSKHPQIIKAKTIALYLANDGELDLAEFIHWCWQQNKQLYLPVLHPFSAGHLLFLNYQADTKMQQNKYGISEPKLDVTKVLPVSQLDVLLTPLVAFDSAGNRMGMGGGYYDRTLAQWHQQHASKPFPIGVAHSCQQVDKIPVEQWDIAIPEILTPDF